MSHYGYFLRDLAVQLALLSIPEMKTMTNQECRDYVLRALAQAKGDDLERANVAFGHMSAEQLDKPWGQSGKTARQVWQEYKDARELHTQAVEWFCKPPF